MAKKLDLKKKITREYLCFIEICFATLIAVSFLIKTNIKIEIHCVSHFCMLPWNTRNEANSRRKNKYRPSHLLRNLIRLPSKSFILPLNKLKATSCYNITCAPTLERERKRKKRERCGLRMNGYYDVCYEIY